MAIDKKQIIDANEIKGEKTYRNDEEYLWNWLIVKSRQFVHKSEMWSDSDKNKNNTKQKQTKTNVRNLKSTINLEKGK